MRGETGRHLFRVTLWFDQRKARTKFFPCTHLLLGRLNDSYCLLRLEWAANHYWRLASHARISRPRQANYVKLSGSGTREFYQRFEDFFNTQPRGKVSNLTLPISQSLLLCNALWGLEVATGGGLSDRWGGGFEIVYFDAGKFRKLSDLLYLYWEATEREDGILELRWLPRFMKVEYQNENLLIRLSDENNGKMKDSIFVVTPMFRASERLELKVPVLSYNWLCSFVAIKRLDGSVEYESRVDYYGGKKRPLEILQSPGRYEISLLENYANDLGANIRANLTETST